MANPINIHGLRLGAGCPLVFIGGPCVIESPAQILSLATALQQHCSEAQIPLVFKASFDKANRTSIRSFRGPGLTEGLQILQEVKNTLKIRVTTDIHHPDQAGPVAEVADLLQIPAFLCRQTDLLIAAGQTGKPVNVKKGQFLAPEDMQYVVEKLVSAGAPGVLLTERGTSFGHRDLVVDFRGFETMARFGPVCFDATHSNQKPGAAGHQSGGNRGAVGVLSSAALAAGADAIFAEIHENPAEALSDAATQLPLSTLPGWLARWKRLAQSHRDIYSGDANP